MIASALEPLVNPDIDFTFPETVATHIALTI